LAHNKKKRRINVPATGMNLMVSADYNEMMQYSISETEIIAQFEKASIGNLLPAISRLIASFHMDSTDTVFDEVIIRCWEHGLHKDYIERVLQYKRPNVFFNNRQMLLNTVKWLIVHADAATYNDVTEINNPSTFMHCFYLSTMLSSFYRIPTDMKIIELESVQNGNFNRDVNYLHTVQRSIECYLNIASQKDRFLTKEYVDIAELFYTNTGVNIKTYLFFMTAINTSFYPSGDVRNFIWTNKMVNDVNKYVQYLGIETNEIQKLFQMTTISIDEFRKNFAESTLHRWDFNYFRKKPIIRQGQIFYPLDSQFVLENIWDGLYWRIIDGLNLESANKFRIFIGRIFELYCHDLLINAEPSLKMARYIPEFQYKYAKNNMLSPDGFIQYRDDLIVFDYKAKRLNMQTTLVDGNIDSFEKDISQLIIEPAKKIYAHLQRFIEKSIESVPIDFTKVKKIHGVIVTQGSMSGVKIVYERIEQRLHHEGLYDMGSLIEWHLLDVNEFERLVSLMEQGCNLGNTFSQKASPRYRYLSFHNYLAYARRPHRHSCTAKKRFNEWLDYVTEVMGRNSPSEANESSKADMQSTKF